jgi:HD-GYP domain-containing protein (c-di-GMP phosphodiesterase class II)
VANSGPVEGAPSSPAATRDGVVGALIAVVASVASVALVLSAAGAWREIGDRPWVFAAFLVVTLGLQLVNVEVYGRGTLSFAGTGLLALGFAFGPGAAMAVAVLAGAVNNVRRRAQPHKGLFDGAQFTLAVGTGAGFYHLVTQAGTSTMIKVTSALAAGALYMAVNAGLVTLAMSLSENTPFLSVWRERFRWFTPYYLASGPLALALVIAYDKTGVTGLFAFAIPPAFMMLSVRQYIARTRESVEEVRRANEELTRANAQLEQRNDDLHTLFEFAGGLAARAHDSHELVGFAEQELQRLAGGVARVRLGDIAVAGGISLRSGGSIVGTVELDGERSDERWQRLREAILPQLATALESSELIDQVRKTHLATIAALSRSMEAKDYYTGGHTERVSDVSVALAKRLGFTGSDLDALEIGALLHDIGKIGIPERILHKPGSLDDEEWRVMKEHPIISEYILSGVDLPEIVLQIARNSHEAYDGSGYPDGLSGEDIPLAARIVLVADAFDALTSDRPYRRGRHLRAAMDEIRAHSGLQFCPSVVEAMEQVYREEAHILGATSLRAVEEVA